MLIKIFSRVWKQVSITILETIFWNLVLANRGPEVFSNRVLPDSGCALVVWTAWPLKTLLRRLDLVYTSAKSPCCSHWHASPCVCDWQAKKLPSSCSGKHVCTRVVCAEPHINVWKVCNSKRYCEMRFTKRHYNWDISAVWKRSQTSCFFFSQSQSNRHVLMSSSHHHIRLNWVHSRGRLLCIDTRPMEWTLLKSSYNMAYLFHFKVYFYLPLFMKINTKIAEFNTSIIFLNSSGRLLAYMYHFYT